MTGTTAELTYETWRARAKAFLHASVPPEAAFFGGSLFAQLPPAGGTLRVPKRFVELAEAVACHRDPSRWDLLYRLLYRLVRTTPHLLDIETDDDVHSAFLMRKAVDRDDHKLRAFVRFRRVEAPPGASQPHETVAAVEGATRYVAWHRPDHFVLARAAPFFVERFANMRWSILTPDSCAHWDGELRFTPGVPREAAPQGDALEELWRDYYASIYNPARTNLKLLKQHVPIRHWQTLPELTQIGQLLQNAPKRVSEMIERTVPQRSAADFVPKEGALPVLAQAAAGCRGCDLCEHATQTVFGRGPANAAIFCVGEQPGDQEDRTGEPFIGPAGRLLDRAFVDAGLAREDLYVTNAVKHFRWTPRGKQRIHQTPSTRQVRACQPWLEAEIDRVRPAVIVCLGRTAAQAVLGAHAAIGELRGRVVRTSRAKGCVVTWHPSALLRMPEAERPRAYAELVADLRLAHDSIGAAGEPELRAGG